jgi:hypothetical protein
VLYLLDLLIAKIVHQLEERELDDFTGKVRYDAVDHRFAVHRFVVSKA